MPARDRQLVCCDRLRECRGLEWTGRAVMDAELVLATIALDDVKIRSRKRR